MALDIDSGERQWTFPIKVSGWESASASNDRVFAGATDGTLYALNAKTGGIEWKTNLGAAITTSVTVSGTDLYAGTSDGKLRRVDARNGVISASYRIDPNLKPRDFPVVSGDSVLVLLADESADNRALVSLDLNPDGVRWRQTADKRWTTTRLLVLGNAVIVGSPDGEVTGYCVLDGTTEGNLSAVRPAVSCKTR